MVELTQAWALALPDNAVAMKPMPANRLAILCADGHLLILDDAAGEVIQTVQAHQGDGFSLDVHPAQALIATGGGDGFVRVWTPEGERVFETKMPASWVEHVRYSSDGAFLAAAAGKTCVILKQDGAEAARHPHPQSTIAALVWRPGKYELFAAGYGGVTIFKPKPGEVLGKLPRQGSILTLASDAPGKHLAAGCQDNAIHFWFVASGKDLFMSGYASKVTQVAFGGEGRYLVSAGGDNLVIWDLGGKGPQGSRPIMTQEMDGPVNALAVSPRTWIAAAGDTEGMLAVYSLKKPPLDLPASALLRAPQGIINLCFSPDGQRLIAALEEGQLVALNLGELSAQ